MPELPEVETVCRGLRPALVGRRLVRVEARRPDLRVPLPENMSARLSGRRVESVARRAKYILIGLDDGATLIVHLGMSGRFTVGRRRNAPPRPHEHVEFETDAGDVATFEDPRRFGLMVLAEPGELESHRLLAGLGPEPLDPAFAPDVLAARLAGRRVSIKAALLDQRVVAGVGNIYASEALFRAGISPFRLAADVAEDGAVRLVSAIKAVLAEAVEAGGSTLRDYVQASGELGYFQHSFAVYGREGEACPGCDCDVAATGGIQRAEQAGRSTFHCPRRQR